MIDMLGMLLGQRLDAVDSSTDSLGLAFDGCAFRSFTKFSASRPIQELVGLQVTSVETEPGRHVQLLFGKGGELVISLAEGDHTGPEAFSARFSNGSIVVG